MRKSRNSKIKWILGAGTILILACSFLNTPSDAHIRSRIVRIGSDKGMCSGEQVRAPSGQDYILTAGHCNSLDNGNGTYNVKTEDGRTLVRRIVAEDPNSDLMLLEGLPDMKGLSIADMSWHGEKIKTYTHGRDLATFSTEGQLIQFELVDIPLFRLDSDTQIEKCNKTPKLKSFPEHGICALHVLEEVTTAFIAPGSSGGAAVNSVGELIGVASASDGQGFFYFVTLGDIKQFLNNY